MTDEETRLNRIGAEICRVVLGHDLRIMDFGPEIYTEGWLAWEEILSQMSICSLWSIFRL